MPSALRIRSGVNGCTVTRAPSGAGASLIAFITAAGAPAVPASPAPFAPSCDCLVGVSTWPTKTAEATVRVYLYGLLAAELKQPLALDGDLWTAGTLNWPERTITPSQSVLGAQTCAMF